MLVSKGRSGQSRYTMKWQEYAYRPSSIVFRNEAFQPGQWLNAVNRKKLLRCAEDHTGGVSTAEDVDLENDLGQFFAPDAEIALDVLQVSGWLLKRNQIDLEKARFSAKRHGGILYFNWFLHQLELTQENPLSHIEFPLHPGRWRISSGTRSR